MSPDLKAFIEAHPFNEAVVMSALAEYTEKVLAPNSDWRKLAADPKAVCFIRPADWIKACEQANEMLNQ